MRAVTVYRVDYGRKTRLPVGVVIEQRTTERRNNSKDLWLLARRLFGLNPSDAVHIAIDVNQARRAASPG
jgi:hypothetical protein